MKIALDATPNASSASTGAAAKANAPLQLDSFVNLSTVESLVAAMITALFFYNVYESTEVGQKINVGTGWRSALIIGGLSGLMNDRIVAALHGLLG